jgi:hypothetical protein
MITPVYGYTPPSIRDKYNRGWVLDPNNPVIAPEGKRAYYPLFEHVPDGVEYDGEDYSFIAWAATASGGPMEAFLSKDFSTWVGPVPLTGGLAGSYYHAASVYVDGAEKPFKMWVWDGLGTTPITGHIHFTESVDGLAWDPVQALTALTVPAGWNDDSYGFCHVNYNPDATNTGDTPSDYTYWGLMNAIMTSTGTEGPLIAWSADGLNWICTISQSIILTITNIAEETHRRYSQVTRGSLVKLRDDSWVGLFSGGRNTDACEALWLVHSYDGMFFGTTDYFPLGQFGDRLVGTGLYGGFRTDCPCMRRVGNKLYLMWCIQQTSSSSSRAIAVATHDV